MSFINKDKLLITTKAGKLWLIDRSGKQSLVSGVPKVFAGGQGGLGDVVLHPDYKKISWFIFLTSIQTMLEKQDMQP